MIIILLILSTGLKSKHLCATWENPLLGEHNLHYVYDLGRFFVKRDKMGNLCNQEPNAAAIITCWQ